MKRLNIKWGSHRLWRIVASGILLVVVAAGVATALSIFAPQASSPTTNTAQPIEPAKPVAIKANTLFVGDTYWGRYVNDWAMKSDLKTEYPFSRLNEFNRDKYDAWIANLECPTVSGFSQTSAQEDATLSFNCSPEYLPEAAKWFTAVSLANNHTDNQGVDGFVQTKQQLDQHDIQYFGHYDPAVLEDACEVVSLPVTVTYDNGANEKHALPIALCGYNGVFKIPPAAAIAEIQKYSQMMPVIAMPHMGAEYQTSPDTLRINTYRAMIDAGADMVLGNHPHWVQSTEAYNGKLIVYSMGNFIFDQQANREVTRSAAINVVLSTSKVPSIQLQNWLKLGDSCATFKDACLAQATTLNLEKLPIEYTYGVVGSSSANKITKPATEAETADMLTRMNWTLTMSQLQSPQGSL